MTKGQTLYRLTPEAEEIIQGMVGASMSEGGPKKPSASTVLCSIILRYDAMIKDSYSRVAAKYSEEEIAAIHAWLECQPSSHEAMVKMERVTDLPAMSGHIVKGSELCGYRHLDSKGRKAVIKVVVKHLKLHEMFAFADTVARRLSKKA